MTNPIAVLGIQPLVNCVETGEDYLCAQNDGILIASAALAITLADNPLTGTPVVIVADGGDVTVDGGAFPIQLGPQTITQGSLALFSFSPLSNSWSTLVQTTESVLPQPSWFIPNWYVDPINGRDTNTGTSPSNPVKTIMGGIVDRWGTTSPILAQNVTIHMLNPETLGQENIVLTPVVVQGSNFAIVCAFQTDGAAFPAGAVTAKTRGAPGNALTVAGFPSGAIGQRVQNLTKGSTATIDAIATGVATLTQPYANAGLTTVTAGPSFVQDNTWAPGDELQLLVRQRLNLTVFEIQGGDANPGETAPTGWLGNAWIPDTGGSPGFSEFTPQAPAASIMMVGCQIDPFLVLNGGGSATECYLPGGNEFSNNATLLGGSSNAAGFVSAAFNGDGVADGDCILHPGVEITGPNNYFGAVQLLGLTNVYSSSSVKISPLNVGLGQLWGSGSVALTGVSGGAAMDAGLVNETGG